MPVRTVTYDTMGKKTEELTVPVEKDRALLILAKQITEMNIKQLYVHYTLETGYSNVCIIADELPDVINQ